MGSDDIIVGNESPVRKSSPAIIAPRNTPVGVAYPRPDQALPRLDSRIDRSVICGEMSQQRGHSGAQSTPQKFLQLVGYRDPNAGVPAKR
jgi:hypothetical protein